MLNNTRTLKLHFIGAALALSMGFINVAKATELSNHSVAMQKTWYSEQDFARALQDVTLDFHDTNCFMLGLKKDFGTVESHKKELTVFPQRIKEILFAATRTLMAEDADSAMQPYLEAHPHFVDKSQVLYLASEIRSVIHQLKEKHDGDSQRQKMRLARRIAVAMKHFDSFIKKLDNGKSVPKRFNRVEVLLQEFANFELDTVELFAVFYKEADMATESVYDVKPAMATESANNTESAK
jgi:hypothetical protein